jgi:molybdopterin synthase catalytic subunit
MEVCLDNGDIVRLSNDIIDVGNVINSVMNDRSGAVSSFIGTTRNTFEGFINTSNNKYELYDVLILLYVHDR